MNAIQRIREKIARGEVVLGTHVSLTDPAITELLGLVGFDALWIDTEHTAIDRGTLLTHLMAARASGAAAFVRLPWNDAVLAKPVLDMGPDGLIFPMIRTATEARAAVSACLYPPAGIRGYGPNRASDYGTMNGAHYLEAAASRFWRVMQIEHVDAVENLEGILAVDGVDAVIVGPNDLAGSIGLIGRTSDPRVVALLDRYASVCRAAGKPYGASVGDDPAVIAEWVNRGVTWLMTGTDTGYLVRGARANLETMRKTLAEGGRS